MNSLILSRRGLFGSAAIAAGVAVLAPRLLMAQTATDPGFMLRSYDRMVGDIKVTTLLDGAIGLDRAIILGVDAATIDAALIAGYLDPAAAIPVPISVHVIRQGDQITLIDSGAGSAFGPGAGKLAQSLAAIGIAPEAVNRLVLTHMHPDHIGGLMTEAGPVFANATLHVSATDLGFWTDEAIAAAAPAEAQGFFAMARGVATGYGERMTPFEGDADLGQGLTAMAMPGHTPGHSGYILSSGNAQLLIWGDMTAIAALQFSHPEAGLTFDVDSAMAIETRRRILDMVATDKLAVAGSHLPFPGFGHVEAKDDAFAWVPEEWSLL